MADETTTRRSVLDDSPLAEALAALRSVVAGVGQAGAEGWSRPTPCAAWNAVQVLQHAAGDQVGWAATVGGGPFPTEDPFAPSGDLAVAP